jgi:hypothetical protein
MKARDSTAVLPMTTRWQDTNAFDSEFPLLISLWKLFMQPSPAPGEDCLKHKKNMYKCNSNSIFLFARMNSY